MVFESDLTRATITRIFLDTTMGESMTNVLGRFLTEAIDAFLWTEEVKYINMISFHFYLFRNIILFYFCRHFMNPNAFVCKILLLFLLFTICNTRKTVYITIGNYHFTFMLFVGLNKVAFDINFSNWWIKCFRKYLLVSKQILSTTYYKRKHRNTEAFGRYEKY